MIDEQIRLGDSKLHRWSVAALDNRRQNAGTRRQYTRSTRRRYALSSGAWRHLFEVSALFLTILQLAFARQASRQTFQSASAMPKKPVRPLGMVRSNAAVPFLNPCTERNTRENENRKLVTALQHAKPVIDNSSPMQHPHLQDNRKREWLSDSKAV